MCKLICPKFWVGRFDCRADSIGALELTAILAFAINCLSVCLSECVLCVSSDESI
jgi:hypothetical protein